MDWFFSDNDTLLYIVLIAAFFAFFLWNNRRLKNDRKRRSDRNFRKCYYERKKHEKEISDSKE